MSLGSRFLASVLQTGSVTEYLQYGKLGHLFDVDPMSKPTFEFVEAYVAQHGKLPPMAWVKEKLGVELADEQVAAGALHKDLFDRYLSRAMKSATTKANELVKDNPAEAYGALMQGLQEIAAYEMAPMVSDFRYIMKEFWPQFALAWSGEGTSIPWRWPTMQEQSKGIRPGDLVSFVGRAGLGKTWLLLSQALYTWEVTGRPVIFVSMEMMREVIMERLAGLYSHTPMDFFKDGILPNAFGSGGKNAVKKKLKAAENHEYPFLVVDGNLTASVEDIVSLCQQYQPAAVFVDGAYMLTPPISGRVTEVEKVGYNVEGLKKQVATKLKIPTIATWQFNREAAKLKVGEKPGLHHIAGNDKIGQLSTIVGGLFQPDDESNIEMIQRREFSILKGRGGEVGSFNITWDFIGMRFDEETIIEGEYSVLSETIY